MRDASETMPPGPPERGGLTVRAVLVVGTAALIVATDQWTKQLARVHLRDSGVLSVPVLGDLLRLTYVENRGAAFGLLQDQTLFFVLVGLVVVGVIIASFRYLPQTSWLLNLALGLQLGGAIGNLIDRVRSGYVVDFVDFGYKTNWWPVFNVADSAIVVGVAILAYSLLRVPQVEPRASRPEA